jgi:prevent-host-death family protein
VTNLKTQPDSTNQIQHNPTQPDSTKTLNKRAIRQMSTESTFHNALDITQVRTNFSETVNQVAYGKERVTITRHGKALVALVPIEDLQLLEELEDRIDLEKTRAALEEVKAQGVVPWEQVKANLGL